MVDPSQHERKTLMSQMSQPTQPYQSQIPPSQQNQYSGNSDEIDDFEDSYPPPGQRTPNSPFIRDTQDNRNDDNEFPYYDPLPDAAEYRQQHERNGQQVFRNAYTEASNFSQGNKNTYKQTQQASMNAPPERQKEQTTDKNLINKLFTMLPKIIPQLIKLLFSNNLTEKIESITSIAKLLDLSTYVNEALGNMNIFEESA